MVIHETEWPYWDKVSLSNTNQINLLLLLLLLLHLRLPPLLSTFCQYAHCV